MAGDAHPGRQPLVAKKGLTLATADLVQFDLAVSVNHDDPAAAASQLVQARNLG